MRRLRRLWRLTATERALVAEALVLLWVIRLGLWLLPFETLRRLLTRVPGVARAAEPAEVVERRVEWAVLAARPCVPRATCLTQALAAQVLLRRHGVRGHLRFGVRSEAGRFEAHAWLEC